MDFNFLNYFFRFENFPVIDPWSAGVELKYYYFGHYLFAGIAKLVGVSPVLAYPLSLATIAYLCWGALYSLFFLILRARYRALFAAILFLFGSNIPSIYRPLADNIALNSGFFWSNTRVFLGGGFSEFPLWSLLFRDLHAHVIAYPFNFVLLFFITAALKLRRIFPYGMAFSWTILFFINSWDFIFYAFGILLLLLFLLKKEFKNILKFIGSTGILLMLIYPSFKGAKNFHWDFVARESMNGVMEHFNFFGGWWIIFCLSLIFVLQQPFKRIKLFNWFLTVYIIVIIFAENITIMDRYNTIFKLYNSAWDIAGVLALGLWFSGFEGTRRCFKYLWMGLSLILFSFFTVGVYSLVVAMIHYNPFNLSYDRATLDGTGYLRKINKPDYELITWINKNIKGSPSIVEAVGENYNYQSSQIGSYTGLPTLLGWPHHVTQRGTPSFLVEKKQKTLERIYKSQDPKYAHFILRKENIKYIVVSRRERLLYQDGQGLYKFGNSKIFFKLVYDKGGALLYEVL